MQNDVPSTADGPGEAPLAERSVERALARRREAYADEVRRLVEASFALIRESGRLEPTVGAIVRAAGLSNQAFYKHFHSKDELLVTVLDEGVRRLASYLEHRMARAATPGERVRAWLEGMTRQALDADAAAATRPFALSRSRLAEGFGAEVAASERRLTEGLRRALEAALEAGDLPQADPPRDAERLYDLAMGWLQRALAEPGPADPADAAHLVAFAFAGVARGAEPR